MGFVLYASSASPIIKPIATEMRVPSVCKSLKTSSKKMEKQVDEIEKKCIVLFLQEQVSQHYSIA